MGEVIMVIPSLITGIEDGTMAGVGVVIVEGIVIFVVEMMIMDVAGVTIADMEEIVTTIIMDAVTEGADGNKRIEYNYLPAEFFQRVFF